jgi:hypothetical protein
VAGENLLLFLLILAFAVLFSGKMSQEIVRALLIILCILTCFLVADSTTKIPFYGDYSIEHIMDAICKYRVSHKGAE